MHLAERRVISTLVTTRRWTSLNLAKLTGELGYSFRGDLYGERFAGAFRVYRVKGDLRWFEQLELPVRTRGL